jgi:hypothetical protein
VLHCRPRLRGSQRRQQGQQQKQHEACRRHPLLPAAQGAAVPAPAGCSSSARPRPLPAASAGAVPAAAASRASRRDVGPKCDIIVLDTLPLALQLETSTSK